LASTLPQLSPSTSSSFPRAQTTDQKHQKQGNFPSFFFKVPFILFLKFLILWHAMMETKACCGKGVNENMVDERERDKN
jgi:hypothetical protein